MNPNGSGWSMIPFKEGEKTEEPVAPLIPVSNVNRFAL
jgi:hypothetical protein